MTALELIRAGQVLPARPWPRHALSPQDWRSLVRALPQQPELRFQALWADVAQVFALFTAPAPLLVSVPVEAGVYAALSPSCPDAALFERMVADLWGHLAADGVDERPWLDHGVWPVLRPMLPRPVPNAGAPEPPEPPDGPGDALHRIALGPVRLGIAEPARLSLVASGDTLVQVEARLGYAHKGTLALMRGRAPDAAARLAARLSGEGTVAHATAFAVAAEAALQVAPPPRALALRAVASRLEWIALALHDIAAALEVAGFQAGPLHRRREAILEASLAAFGHRLLMDLVVPGGVGRDLVPAGAAAIAAALPGLDGPFWTAGFARRAEAAGSLTRLTALQAGLRAAAGSLAALLPGLPPGPLQVPLPYGGGEGLGHAEGPRGVVWHWLLLRDGRIVEAFARDPAWLAWPAMAQAARGRHGDDLGLLAAACGLSVSGMDL